MADLSAGTEILALDFPPAVWDYNTTQIDNWSTTTYGPGSPIVSVTFMAPSSGRVLVIVGGGLGNSASSRRIFIAAQVFEGTSASGTEVMSPTVRGHGITSENSSSAFHYHSRETILSGLTPGATYYARTMHAVATTADAGTVTADIAVRQIIVAPIP